MKEFERRALDNPTRGATLDPFIRYTVAAGALAVAASGLEISGEFAERVHCYVSAGLGGMTTMEATCKTLREKGHGTASRRTSCR